MGEGGEAVEGRDGPTAPAWPPPLPSADFCHHAVVLTVFALHINRPGRRVLRVSGSHHPGGVYEVPPRAVCSRGHS